MEMERQFYVPFLMVKKSNLLSLQLLMKMSDNPKSSKPARLMSLLIQLSMVTQLLSLLMDRPAQVRRTR